MSFLCLIITTKKYPLLQYHCCECLLIAFIFSVPVWKMASANIMRKVWSQDQTVKKFISAADFDKFKQEGKDLVSSNTFFSTHWWLQMLPHQGFITVHVYTASIIVFSNTNYHIETNLNTCTSSITLILLHWPKTIPPKPAGQELSRQTSCWQRGHKAYWGHHNHQM